MTVNLSRQRRGRCANARSQRSARLRRSCRTFLHATAAAVARVEQNKKDETCHALGSASAHCRDRTLPHIREHARPHETIYQSIPFSDVTCAHGACVRDVCSARRPRRRRQRGDARSDGLSAGRVSRRRGRSRVPLFSCSRSLHTCTRLLALDDISTTSQRCDAAATESHQSPLHSNAIARSQTAPPSTTTTQRNNHS